MTTTGIAFFDLLKTWRENPPEKLPFFVNHCLRALVTHNQKQAGFIERVAGKFQVRLQDTGLLEQNNFQVVLNLEESIFQQASAQKSAADNAALLLFALLCRALQQEMTLPEFRKLAVEDIQAAKQHLLAIADMHASSDSSGDAA